MDTVSRKIYLVAAWLFVAGVTVQVFLAGMVVVASQWGWDRHIGLGHALGLPLLVMLVTAYTGRLPRPMKWLTWGLFLVYIVQADVIIFLRGSAPVLSAFHPVLALIDFALGITLALRAGSLSQVPAADHSLLAEPAASSRG
jgi:mercuric ion transport protein